MTIVNATKFVGFRTITKELAKDWDLGALLQGVLKKPDKPDKKMIPVILGEKMVKIQRKWSLNQEKVGKSNTNIEKRYRHRHFNMVPFTFLSRNFIC